MSIREQEEQAERERKRKAAAKRRRAKEAAEEARQALKKQGERKRAFERAQQRWVDCLQCLQESVPRLRANPWLIIQEPPFIHDYLDSLTETLANLSKHENDLETVRKVLQDVYEAFVDVGRFARFQPAFYISDRHTIKRFARLLEQVAHKGTDKALFPNVLSLLGPTFARLELAELVAETRIVSSLMSFCKPPIFLPTRHTLGLLFDIFERLSKSTKLKAMFMDDKGWPRLVGLVYGKIEGLDHAQQKAGQEALRLFPKPSFDDEEETKDLNPTPTTTTTSSSSSSESKSSTQPQPTQHWAEWTRALPVGPGEDQKQLRKDMFAAMDTNNSGKLSLDDITKGVENRIHAGENFDLAKLVEQAYLLSASADGKVEHEETVEFSEFWILLVYLKTYFGYQECFALIDANQSGKLSLEEFKEGLTIFKERMGLEVEDPEATFNELDATKDGTVTFDEFFAFAVKPVLAQARTQ